MNKMNNIRLVSDVHLEHYNENNLPNFCDIVTPNKNDILCLLGDIGNPYQSSYYKFLSWCRDNFHTVLVIAGNHEYYGSSIPEVNNLIQKICKELDIHFLNNSVYIHKNIAFIGTILWSYIPPELYDFISTRMNDYRLIQNLTPEKSSKFFLENINFLEKSIDTLRKQNYKIVILSHHTPSRTNTSFAPYERELQNCAFSTNLCDIIKKVDLWMYGHTHFNNVGNVIYKYNVPLVSNQMGYPGHLVENFNKDFVVYNK